MSVVAVSVTMETKFLVREEKGGWKRRTDLTGYGDREVFDEGGKVGARGSK
ncbi:MAG: hypothetical protein H5U03_03730 [Clostridia bacterium]|nr:hypothetical protein [Clostridia bacterium]